MTRLKMTLAAERASNMPTGIQSRGLTGLPVNDSTITPMWNGKWIETSLEPDPDTSPFSSPMVTLPFAGGHYLTVHRALIPKESALRDVSTSSLDLEHISCSAGHIIVQYLYKNEYQELERPCDSSIAETDVAKLKTAFQVYTTARTFGLHRLEELSREKISLYSASVNAFEIIDVVKDIYPAPVGKDTWFPEFIKSCIKSGFKDSAVLKTANIFTDIGDATSLAKLLLRGLLEVYDEMVQSLDAKDAPAEPDQSTPTTPETPPPFSKGADVCEITEPVIPAPPELEPEPKPVPDCYPEFDIQPTAKDVVEQELTAKETSEDPVADLWGMSVGKLKKGKKKGKKDEKVRAWEIDSTPVEMAVEVLEPKLEPETTDATAAKVSFDEYLRKVREGNQAARAKSYLVNEATEVVQVLEPEPEMADPLPVKDDWAAPAPEAPKKGKKKCKGKSSMIDSCPLEAAGEVESPVEPKPRESDSVPATHAWEWGFTRDVAPLKDITPLPAETATEVPGPQPKVQYFVLSDTEDSWGKTVKKGKKGKKGKKKPVDIVSDEPPTEEPVSDLFVVKEDVPQADMAEEEPDVAKPDVPENVEEMQRDPWAFWGAAKSNRSPRQSL